MKEYIENAKIEEKKTGRVKLVFDRIWVTFVIVMNSLYGLIITALAFASVTSPNNYYISEYFNSFIVSFVMIVALNIINFVTRKYLKNY